MKFVERIESQGEDLGWKKSGENIWDDNSSIFKTLGTLNIDTVKAHYNPKWPDSTEEQDTQFCILPNMIFFIQSVLDER